MTEARIAFLYKAASVLPAANNNKTEDILRSYYRMRCKEISKGYGLPQKQFSEEVMCTQCCLEWRTGIEVRSIQLSRRQRKRIKSRHKMNKHHNKVHLLHSNEIERTCNFCRHSTKTVAMKPNKPIIMKSQQTIRESKGIPNKKNENLDMKMKNNQSCDVYSNIVQVFSLNNKKNTLKSTIKEPKVIKNNKKKKDKYAGLCKKAVLMSAHLKQEKAKLNQLDLFLKPSS